MYIYKAALYCDDCGLEIMDNLSHMEGPFDSDDYPMYVLPSELSRLPNHCESLDECLNAIDLGEYGLAPDAPLVGAETRRVGALLNDDLGDDGYRLIEDLRIDQANGETTPFLDALLSLYQSHYER